MASRTTLLAYNAYQGPQPLGVLWRMEHGTRTLICALATHRLGWELRASVGAELMRSQVCKSETEVFDVSAAWEAEASAKGWLP